ncbi:methylated-DNA-[protein]-cysteine S-methyltransferase [Tistlia consotensis]|uniref:methylated-DNA--[protein]-cysteine S-methyltransferase n=1 Tax=Tistlia consotensis USBA 355 TaxID=560819 RepID=A0A1Y6CLV3_9PROT|nr:methylated-DNA--[protein]-cysteine S-methyltransferase [Tistlia consotensis]SMF72499.1 methylated-DNA-[protein]-cysteine S-methyltransferase [Tistlia consotensis USBA 355]SNS09240.1 methylated-DNA-[protein]-cysteine S-methyltransferase [Tistlia consotensis]
MTGELFFTLFETAVGCCGLAWGERGLVAVQLPEGSEEATRGRLERRFPRARELAPQEAPSGIASARRRIVALLDGGSDDLADLRLDLGRVEAFNREVYAVARTIRPGETLTYGEVAARIGQPEAAQAVGRALGRNLWPIVVPCHRVLAAGGRIGGFSATSGIALKRRLLAIESVHAGGPPTLFDWQRAG